MCSLAIDSSNAVEGDGRRKSLLLLLLLSNVFCHCRMCSLTIDCVLLLQTVFSYYRICSLAIDSSQAAEGAGHKTFACVLLL